MLTSEFSDALKTSYEKRLLSNAYAKLVHGRFGEKATINKFHSLEWRRYGSLSAVTTALTEGTTPAEQASMSLTTVTATPSYYGAWMLWTDELDMETYDPIVSTAVGELGYQAGLSIDTIIRDAVIAGATTDYVGTVTARTSLDYPTHRITYADFLYQYAALQSAGAQGVEGENYVVIIDPFTHASLMHDDMFKALFVAAEQSGKESAVRNGYIGRIMNCNIYVTSNAKEYADGGIGSTTDVYAALFIGRESFGTVSMASLTPNMIMSAGTEGPAKTWDQIKPVQIIMKQLGSAGANDALDQRGSIGWKTSLDVQVLKSDWVRVLEHVNEASDD